MIVRMEFHPIIRLFQVSSCGHSGRIGTFSLGSSIGLSFRGCRIHAFALREGKIGLDRTFFCRRGNSMRHWIQVICKFAQNFNSHPNFWSRPN